MRTELSDDKSWDRGGRSGQGSGRLRSYPEGTREGPMTSRQDCGLCKASAEAVVWEGPGGEGRAVGERLEDWGAGGLGRAEEGEPLLLAWADPSLLSIFLSASLCLNLSIHLLTVPHNFSFLFLSRLWLSISQGVVNISPIPSISHCLSVCPSLNVSPSPCSLLPPNTSPVYLLCSSCWPPLLPIGV